MHMHCRITPPAVPEPEESCKTAGSAGSYTLGSRQHLCPTGLCPLSPPPTQPLPLAATLIVPFNHVPLPCMRCSYAGQVWFMLSLHTPLACPPTPHPCTAFTCLSLQPRHTHAPRLCRSCLHLRDEHPSLTATSASSPCTHGCACGRAYRTAITPCATRRPNLSRLIRSASRGGVVAEGDLAIPEARRPPQPVLAAVVARVALHAAVVVVAARQHGVHAGAVALEVADNAVAACRGAHVEADATVAGACGHGRCDRLGGDDDDALLQRRLEVTGELSAATDCTHTVPRHVWAKLPWQIGPQRPDCPWHGNGDDGHTHALARPQRTCRVHNPAAGKCDRSPSQQHTATHILRVDDVHF